LERAQRNGRNFPKKAEEWGTSEVPPSRFSSTTKRIDRGEQESYPSNYEIKKKGVPEQGGKKTGNALTAAAFASAWGRPRRKRGDAG